MKTYYTPSQHQVRHMFHFNVGGFRTVNGRCMSMLDMRRDRRHREPWSIGNRSHNSAWPFKRFQDLKSRMRTQYRYQSDDMDLAITALHRSRV